MSGSRVRTLPTTDRGLWLVAGAAGARLLRLTWAAGRCGMICLMRWEHLLQLLIYCTSSRRRRPKHDHQHEPVRFCKQQRLSITDDGLLCQLKAWRPISDLSSFTDRFQDSRRRSTLGSEGGIAPNFGFAPQMRHEILFDELIASAHRCKKERSVAFKYAKISFQHRCKKMFFLNVFYNSLKTCILCF